MTMPYKTLPPEREAFRVAGQIFWIPALYTMNALHVLRITKWDRRREITSAECQIRTATSIKSAFKSRSQSDFNYGLHQELFAQIPIPELNLKFNEELLINKAKRRPGLLIDRNGMNPRRVSQSFVTGKNPPNPNQHLFAPIVSLHKDDDASHDYPDAFIRAVQAQRFPEYIYLPPEGTVIINESMAILSEIQPCAINTVKPTSLQFDPEIFIAHLRRFERDLEGQILRESRPTQTQQP